MSNLALLYKAQGTSGRSRAAVPGIPRHQSGRCWETITRDTMNSMNNLANLYTTQKRYEEAESLHRETLQKRQELLGERTPHTLTSLSNLANLYVSQDRYDEAEPLRLEALAIKRRVLGDEHVSTGDRIPQPRVPVPKHRPLRPSPRENFEAAHRTWEATLPTRSSLSGVEPETVGGIVAQDRRRCGSGPDGSPCRCDPGEKNSPAARVLRQRFQRVKLETNNGPAVDSRTESRCASRAATPRIFSVRS